MFGYIFQIVIKFQNIPLNLIKIVFNYSKLKEYNLMV